MTRRTTTLGIVLAVTLIAGSTALLAATKYLVEHWAAERSDAGKHTTALVVGVVQDLQARKNFENKMVSHLRGREIKATTSYSVVPDLANPQSRSEIADLLDETGVDAVITVRAIPAQSAPDGDYTAAWKEEAAAELEVRPYVLEALAKSDPKSKRVTIEIGVWDRQSRSRIWAARTETLKRTRLRKLAGTIMQETIDGLERDNLF